MKNPVNELNLLTDNASLCAINVYFPYCCSDSLDPYLQYMMKFQVWAESLDNANFCIVGIFNASSAIMFGKLLEDFAAQQDLIISDNACLPSDTFTHLCDAHGTLIMAGSLLHFLPLLSSVYW